MFEKILVPLDGSTTAEMVIPYVIDFGWHFGARITLIRVGESEKMVPDYRGYLEKIAAGIEQTIRKTENKKQSDIEISVNPVSGNTGDSILKAAQDKERPDNPGQPGCLQPGNLAARSHCFRNFTGGWLSGSAHKEEDRRNRNGKREPD